MKLQDAKREVMRMQWKEMVGKCRGSGQTVEAWCQGRNISVSTYYRRQRQVWDRESEELPAKLSGTQSLQMVSGNYPATTFEMVPHRVCHTEEPGEDARITLHKGEWRVEIRSGAEAGLLREIIEALQ